MSRRTHVSALFYLFIFVCVSADSRLRLCFAHLQPLLLCHLISVCFSYLFPQNQVAVAHFAVIYEQTNVNTVRVSFMAWCRYIHFGKYLLIGLYFCSVCCTESQKTAAVSLLSKRDTQERCFF